MKNITVQLTAIEYEAWKLLAAEKVLQIDDPAISSVIRSTLLDYLDEACRVDRRDVINLILDPSTERPTNGHVEAAKARQEKRVEQRSDLKMPNQEHNEKPSNTWAVWSWLVKEQLDTAHTKQWGTFVSADATRGSGLDSTKCRMAVDTLVRSHWLVEAGKTDNGMGQQTNLYTFSQKARAWLMEKKNQKELIDMGVIEPVREENGYSLSEDMAR